MTVLEYSTLAALLAVLFAFHFAAVWLAQRGAGRTGEERPDRLEDGRLRCPNCEAVNEPEYRFCRECVSELRERASTAPVRPAGGGPLFR